MKYLTMILLAVVASACAGQTVKPALPIQQTTPSAGHPDLPPRYFNSDVHPRCLVPGYAVDWRIGKLPDGGVYQEPICVYLPPMKLPPDYIAGREACDNVADLENGQCNETFEFPKLPVCKATKELWGWYKLVCTWKPKKAVTK